jgi:hypothetical protein
MCKLAARLLCALAFLVTFHSAAEAQAGERIREAELRMSSAPSLSAAIAELRPGWVFTDAAGGSDVAGARAVVFVNGRQAASLDTLRLLPTAQVASVHLRSPVYVRQNMARTPRDVFDIAIFVSTRGAPVPRQGRLTVSLDVGYSVRALPEVALDALRDAGYSEDYESSPGGGGVAQQEGPLRPPGVGATLHYGIRGPWGAGVIVSHTLEGRVGAQDPNRSLEAVTTTMTSTEVALVGTWHGRVLRVGAGPAVRSVSWSWADGFNPSGDREGSTTTGVGMAAELLAALPVRSPVFPQFKVLARYYPSQTTEFSELEDPLEVGGLVVTMGLGVATRF